MSPLRRVTIVSLFCKGISACSPQLNSPFLFTYIAFLGFPKASPIKMLSPVLLYAPPYSHMQGNPLFDNSIVIFMLFPPKINILFKLTN